MHLLVHNRSRSARAGLLLRVCELSLGGREAVYGRCSQSTPTHVVRTFACDKDSLSAYSLYIIYVGGLSCFCSGHVAFGASSGLFQFEDTVEWVWELPVPYTCLRSVVALNLPLHIFS